MIISLGIELPRPSSDLPGDIGRASLFARRLTTSAPSPYSVLLRVTLTLPSVLPQTRWALTPPFHPYLSPKKKTPLWAIGGLFSVALVSDRSAWALPSTLPTESGLSSCRSEPAGDHLVFSSAPHRIL